MLNDLLTDLKIKGSVYFCDYLDPPWKLDYRHEARALFHMVRRGRCVLNIDDHQYELATGDFVFVSPAIDHQLIASSGDSHETLLLCGYSTFEADEFDLLVKDIPRYIVIQQEQLLTWPWLKRTLEHLNAEYRSEAPGTEITVNKLTEILIVQLLRSEFGEQKDVGIIAALRDKRLAKALAAIHKDLSRAWTIESAANEASLSRSGFSKNFTEVMNISFYDYLTQSRMRRARQLLKRSQLSVAEVALEVGYQSDLAFIKTFKKLTGITPRAFRVKSSQ